VRRLFYPALGVPFGVLASLWVGLPLGFLILTILVRAMPHIIAPTLTLRRSGSITALGLTDDGGAISGETGNK